MKNESTINKTTFVDILKHDKFFVALIAVFVFIICAWHIPQRESIYLTTDEFSQYSIAAFFAGFDWSNVPHMFFITNLGTRSSLSCLSSGYLVMIYLWYIVLLLL